MGAETGKPIENKRSVRLKKNIVFITIGLILIGGLMLRSSLMRTEIVCSDLKVRVYPENEMQFISNELIYNLLENDRDSVIGVSIDSLSLKSIEEAIEKNPSVKRATAYYSLNGVMGVKVEQRKPLVRIHGSEEAFYLDEDGAKMPLSDRYTARVITVSGHQAEDKCDEIYKLVKFINRDKLFKAQIVGIFVNEDSEYVLQPSVGTHRILLGDISSLEDKFENLKHSYQNIFEKYGWDYYSLINLKFENQVVCTKK